MSRIFIFYVVFYIMPNKRAEKRSDVQNEMIGK